MVVLKSVRSIFMLAGASALVAGCSYMEDMPGPGGEDQKACTREYAPVCGAKGYKRKNFNNTCEAHNAGYSVVKEGKCGS